MRLMRSTMQSWTRLCNSPTLQKQHSACLLTLLKTCLTGMSMKEVSEFSMCIASFPGRFQFTSTTNDSTNNGWNDNTVYYPLVSKFQIPRHIQCVCTGMGISLECTGRKLGQSCIHVSDWLLLSAAILLSIFGYRNIG